MIRSLRPILKRAVPMALIAALSLTGLSACATGAVMDKIRSTEEVGQSGKLEKQPGKPAYGLLLPAALAVDAATAPLVIPYLMFLARAMQGC
ncbi:MAG TPA: hypothetical protein VG796_21380 [Verrucomicrobiales bacterium]|jgi:hypothetical protein|nr:hypothetical protein [Verrucomicrobiales bacterium]